MARATPSSIETLLADRSTVLVPASFSVLQKLSLSAEEGFLLSRFSGPMSVGDLMSVCGLGEAHTLRLLLGLVSQGALGVPPSEKGKPWEGFQFSPEELGEQVELDLERRKEILFLFHTLNTTSHWRLLGVPVDAPLEKIRSAYFEKSKRFHPDTFFRLRMGRYQQRVEAIFQRLKLAWETLSDEHARLKYEREGKHFTDAEKAAMVNLEIARIENEQRAKERRGRLLHSRGFARLTKAREVLAEGDRALARGEVSAATSHYTLALELDPRLDEAKSKLVEARRVGLVRRADSALHEALNALNLAQPQRAIELLRGALELDPNNPGIRVALARALHENDPKQVREACSHLGKALELGDGSAATRLLYGELLLECGQNKQARIHLERAAREGESQRAEELLRRC